MLGIVFGLFCCGILGIVFGDLSIRDARRYGKSPLLGCLAIAFGVINIIGSAILRARRQLPFWTHVLVPLNARGPTGCPVDPLGASYGRLSGRT